MDDVAIPKICKEGLRQRLLQIRTDEEKRMLRDFLISKGSEELAAKFQLLVNGSTHVKITFEDLKGCPFNPAIQFPINY